MNYADYMYLQNLLNIVALGTKERGTVRTKWPDGQPAPTVKLTDISTKYRITPTEFPLLTIRPVNLYKAVDEMLWIYQKKSNNIRDLHSHVWDAWADEFGSVGKTYGYQAGKKYNWPEGYLDQVDRALWMIQNKPMSRHIIINLWNPADYSDMNLAPCCCWLQFNVSYETESTKVGRLDMTLYQRSLDMMAAGGWDVAAHAALLMMFARHCGLRPGNFTHFVSNMHIYDRHVSLITDVLNRYTGRMQIQSPHFFTPEHTVKFADDAPTNFYEMKPEHFIVENYHPAADWPRFEVAI